VPAPADVVAGAQIELEQRPELRNGTRQPRNLPTRDPMGSRHLAELTGHIVKADSFPDAEADRVDAELIADGLEPETRVTPLSVLAGTNAGTEATADDPDEAVETYVDGGQDWITVHLAGRDPAEVIAANEPADAELIDRLDEAYKMGEMPKPGGPHKGDDYDAEQMPEPRAELYPGGPIVSVEDTVPGPEETAPLPAGWESHAEQAAAGGGVSGALEEDRNTIPKPLGPSLQEAADRRRVEDKLIRKIQVARVIDGEPDSLMDLYRRASKAGAWSDRVKAAASARRKELEAAGSPAGVS
jgi:hypothetical protein